MPSGAALQAGTRKSERPAAGAAGRMRIEASPDRQNDTGFRIRFAIGTCFDALSATRTGRVPLRGLRFLRSRT